MDTEKSWKKFIISGSINDYLTFVNSRKENEIGEGIRNPVYDTRLGNKGNERGRE